MSFGQNSNHRHPILWIMNKAGSCHYPRLYFSWELSSECTSSRNTCSLHLVKLWQALTLATNVFLLSAFKWHTVCHLLMHQKVQRIVMINVDVIYYLGCNMQQQPPRLNCGRPEFPVVWFVWRHAWMSSINFQPTPNNVDARTPDRMLLMNYVTFHMRFGCKFHKDRIT